MRKHRKGLKVMEKPITAKYRTQFWYIALASFVLWLFLLYFFNSSATTVRNEERLFRQEENKFPVSVKKSDSSFVPSDENSGENNTTLPISDQMEEVTGINDIVEELEKETEKNKKSIIHKGDVDDDSFPGKHTRFASDAMKDRESGRARSWNRQSLDNEKKNSDDSFTGKQTGFDSNDQLSDKDSGVKTDKELLKRTGSNGQIDKELNKRTRSNGGVTIRRRNEKRRRPFGRRRQQPIDFPKPNENKIENVRLQPRKTNLNDPCTGKYVYIHEIPALFNDELLKNCWSLSPWTDMCELTSNLGLGPRLPDMERVSSWFATNQFTLEVIFHNRMKQYKCLTKDSSLASAIFVPYYAGLDVMRYLWGPFPNMKDAAALDLMKWIRDKTEWKRMNGRDHFMVAGRTTWDFMRTPENDSDWGNRLMILPEPRNMTMLLIESSPWNYHGFAIPYPTYFHPSSDMEILQWQNRMRRIKRRYLFSFVGAPRPHLGDSIRGDIIDQCRASRRKCNLLECVSGSNKCYKPDQIMNFFLSSTFCLQPPGDSYTRRSTFDSILAGCIPVFFHPGSAYAQYIWHLPKDIGSYSVFIPVKDVKEGKASIERVLNRIPAQKIVAMREEVIKLIPKVVYANPSSRLVKFEDAFDLTIKGVLDRVGRIRSKIKEGKEEELFDFPEEFSWKYNTFGNVEKHEWDAYFDRP